MWLDEWAPMISLSVFLLNRHVLLKGDSAEKKEKSMLFKLINPSHFPLSSQANRPLLEGGLRQQGRGVWDKTKHCCLFSWRWQKPSHSLCFGWERGERERVKWGWGGVWSYTENTERKYKGKGKSQSEQEEKQWTGESTRPHARSWVRIIAEDHGICWPPYVHKGSTQMTVQWHTGHWSRVSSPLGRVSLSLYWTVFLSPSPSQITQVSPFHSPLISLLLSSVPCYPINSLSLFLPFFTGAHNQIRFAPSSERKN